MKEEGSECSVYPDLALLDDNFPSTRRNRDLDTVNDTSRMPVIMKAHDSLDMTSIINTKFSTNLNSGRL